MSMSDEVMIVLKKSGWFEGREIDITENIKFLESKGFVVFDSARKFMKMYGELDINVERKRIDGHIKISEHTTCISKVIGLLDSSCFGLENFIDHDNKFIEENVIPIGVLYNHEITLYISESEKFYLQIGWIGDNVNEALENIILDKGGRRWKEIRYK